MTRPVAALLFAAVLSGGSCVAQEVSPIDGETVHSAYCIPIVQGALDLDKEVQAELTKRLRAASSDRERALLRQQKETTITLTALDEARLSRLRAGVPSVLRTASAALAEATKRGESDRERFRTETKQCLDRCVSPTLHDASKVTACLRSCPDQQLNARIKGCEAPGLESRAPNRP